MDAHKHTGSESPRQFGLIESLDREWLKLPTAIMNDVGPATQTLAGLLKIASRETFVETAKIAHQARVPLKTARKHLQTLADKGWITNAGRGRTRRGAARRTCTIRLNPKTK